MTTAIQKADSQDLATLDALERVILEGDLSKLTQQQKLDYYIARCDAAGLDYRTQPFAYITLQNKLTLYAQKSAAEQLCQTRDISTAIVGREQVGDVHIVTCRASMPSGRFSESTGAVNLAGKRGDDLCNAYMKAETKSKRRAVLSLCGMGMMDETEAETLPGTVTLPTVTAHPEPEPSPPLATDAQLRECENLRAKAMTLGFKTKKNADPSPCVPGTSRRVCIAKRNVYADYIAAHSGPAPTEPEPPVESPVETAPVTEGQVVEGEASAPPMAPTAQLSPRLADLDKIAGNYAGYTNFLGAVEIRGLRWIMDADVAALEDVLSRYHETLIVADQMSAADWEDTGNLVIKGDLSW